MGKKFIGIRIPHSIYNKIKDISYWQRIFMTDFIVEALQSHIGQYERERGSEFPKRSSYDDGE